MDIKRMLIAIICATAAGCGGGGGGSSMPSARPAATVSGNAVDALILDGDIAVYEFRSGAKGKLLGTARTDSYTGAYSLNITAPSQPILLELTSGYYTEEASGVRVTLKDGQRLTALTHFESGRPVRVMVTPWTHIATGLVEYKIAHGTTVGNAITEANTAVSNILGIDILSTYPRNITDPSNMALSLTDELLYGFIAAGVSSWTAWASDQNGQSVHTLYTSIALSQLMYDDVRADGALNGRKMDAPLAFGGVALDANVYRAGFATHILRMAGGERNVTGLLISDLLPDANQVASSTHALFGNMPPQPIDTTPPAVAATEAAGLWKSGVFTYRVKASDFVGVKRVRFFVDGTEVGEAADLSDPAISLDSRLYTDGDHVIGVIAEDQVGNATDIIEFPVRFDNTGAVALVTSPTITNTTPATVQGTWADNGPGIAEIRLAGKAVTVNTDGTWSGSLVLNPGAQTVQLAVTDLLGNTKSYDVTFALDQAPPTLLATYSTNVQYVAGASVYVDSFAFATQKVYPILVTTDRVSADGVPYYDLENHGYPVVSWTVNDVPFAGVRTAPEDLVVEGRYLRNGTVMHDWHPAANTGGPVYYMAPITEILGDDWHDVGPYVVHRYELRVRDNAGNVTTQVFEFRADVRPLAPNVVVQEFNPVAGVAFADRTSVAGQSYHVHSYEFENTTPYPYFLNLSDADRGTATVYVDSAVRENKARLKTTEQWRLRWIKGAGGAPNCSDWYSVSSVYNWTGVRWELFSPPVPTYGTIQNVSSDAPTAPSPTVWANYHPDTDFYYGESDYGPAEYGVPSLSGTGLRSGFFQSSSGSWSCNGLSYNSSNPWYGFQRRNVYTYVPEPGFPRNVATTFSESAMIRDGAFIVKDAQGLDLAPIDDWYKIEPGQRYTIERWVIMPALMSYNDTAVSNLATFASYTPRHYDRSVEWVIPRAITMAIVHAATPTAVHSRTPLLHRPGNGVTVLSVVR